MTDLSGWRELGTLALISAWCHGPASPFLPAAFEPVLLAYGRVHPPLIVAVVSTLASIPVEAVNYLGYRWLLDSNRLRRVREASTRVTRLFARQPFLTCLLVAATPVPDWSARILGALARYSPGVSRGVRLGPSRYSGHWLRPDRCFASTAGRRPGLSSRRPWSPMLDWRSDGGVEECHGPRPEGGAMAEHPQYAMWKARLESELTAEREHAAWRAQRQFWRDGWKETLVEYERHWRAGLERSPSPPWWRLWTWVKLLLGKDRTGE